MVYQWERFAKRFESFGTRVILGRFSMILSDDGGALQTMKLPYKFFVGGKLGSGFQWYSWIHINDLVRAILFTIDNPKAKVHSIWLHQLLNAKIYLGHTCACHASPSRNVGAIIPNAISTW